MLRLAVEWEIILSNPAQGVKAPRVPAGRVRYLQPAELHSVVEACPPSIRPVVALAVATRMRRSEILGLRWPYIDLDDGRLILPQTKNGDNRVVYLNRLAQTVLRALPISNPTGKLFADLGPEQVSVTFGQACRKAGVADFRFHDLRHTAASWLRMAGADTHTVPELLGHKDLRIAARYHHLSPTFLAEAVGRLDSVFGDLRYPGVTAPKALMEASPVTA